MSESGTAVNPGSKEALAIGCTCPVLDNGLRWLEVRGVIARHEAEAEHLRLRQWMVADFQRQVRGQG